MPSRKQMRASLAKTLDKLSTLEAASRGEINRLFPAGEVVEVELRHGQKVLTKGVSGGASWGHGCVEVQIDTAKPHSRNKWRRVHYTRCRLEGEDHDV